MDSKGKSWLAGCGCGCLTAFVLFLVTGGLTVGVFYLLWENDIGGELTSGPWALGAGAVLGIVVGGLAGLISLLVARKIALKRFEAKDQPQASPPAAPPPA